MSNIHPVTPDISVLLSVFNEEKYIVDTITSVLDQTYENFELIIIDDASTDNTPNILESFNKDRRISIYSNKQNIGLAQSLNIGIGKCRGQYIARIDGDDIMDKKRLGIQYEYLMQNQDVKVVGSYMHLIDKNGKIIGEGHWPCGVENTLFNSLCGKNPLGHPGVMMEKIAVSNVNNYSEDFLFSQDYDLWLKLLYKGYLIDNIPQYLTLYRDTENNLVEKKQKQELYHRRAFYNYANAISNMKIKSTISDRFLDCLIFNNNNNKFMDYLFVIRFFNYLFSNIAIEIMVDIDKKIYNKMFFDDFKIKSPLLKILYLGINNITNFNPLTLR